MSVYSYVGVDQKGKKVTGIVDAEGDKAARAKLRKMNIFPTSVSVGRGGFASVGNKTSSKRKAKAADLAVMTRQLATLLGAGIPLVDALTALIDQVDSENLKTIVTSVREKVTTGSKLSDALAGEGVFNDLYINMIRAGESSGALEIVLERLSEFMESQQRMRGKVMSAMIYPNIMSTVGIGLMTILLTFVVPKITKIFIDMKLTLPLPTKILITVSDFFVSKWYLIAILVGGLIYFGKRWASSPGGHEFIDRKKITLPVFGKLFRMISVSRFTRTLSTLLNSGVPLLASLDIVANVVENVILQRVIESTKNNVKEGESLAEPLKRSGEFPPMVTHMIATGEKTGELEKMLSRVADTYDEEVDRSLSRLVALLEPVMILVMAAMVGSIVVSILLPMLKMNQIHK